MSVYLIRVLSHLACVCLGGAIGFLTCGLLCASCKSAGWEHDGGEIDQSDLEEWQQ